MNKGRFPANLLVSDDVLNDGRVYKSGALLGHHKRGDTSLYGGNSLLQSKTRNTSVSQADEGSFSRFFDLDKWYNNLNNHNE